MTAVAPVPASPSPATADAWLPRLPVPSPTALETCDAAVAELRAAADRWARTDASRVAALLDEVLGVTAPLIGRWTELGAIHEGVDPRSPDAAEEAISGPYVFLRSVRLHRDAVRQIARDGVPRIPGRVRTLPDGQVAAGVMPAGLVDRVAYVRITAEVRMERGLAAGDLRASMANAWRTPPPGRVALVLGGGNVSSIGPLDVLHKLVVAREAVILKVHPVMAHLADLLAAGLAPFIREGVLRIVTGDAVQGAYLASHPGVDTLHITGSDRTYDAIVFGTGPEGAARRLRDDPVLHKPFTAELGNLTPIVVVPGRWTRRELDHQVENVVTMLVNNAGFNCTTSRVIVTARSWPQRQAFLDGIRRRLGELPTRLAFYPGAATRFGAFREAHPEAELIGRAGEGHLPWMVIAGLSPDATDDPAYRVEAFCSVTAETPLDAPDAVTFLDQAVAFVNERIWGTLNATVIADPRTARDPAVAPALERAVDRLHYGTVALNTWSAAGYGIGITPWGAAPGNPRSSIGSGTGWVHNPLMFERVEKVVIRGPFVPWLKPPWYTSHRTALPLMQEMARFEADGRPTRLLPVGWRALRG